MFLYSWSLAKNSSSTKLLWWLNSVNSCKAFNTITWHILSNQWIVTRAGYLARPSASWKRGVSFPNTVGNMVLKPLIFFKFFFISGVSATYVGVYLLFNVILSITRTLTKQLQYLPGPKGAPHHSVAKHRFRMSLSNRWHSKSSLLRDLLPQCMRGRPVNL